jgi:hypothetical protein
LAAGFNDITNLGEVAITSTYIYLCDYADKNDILGFGS